MIPMVGVSCMPCCHRYGIFEFSLVLLSLPLTPFGVLAGRLLVT